MKKTLQVNDFYYPHCKSKSEPFPFKGFQFSSKILPNKIKNLIIPTDEIGNKSEKMLRLENLENEFISNHKLEVKKGHSNTKDN